MDESGELVGLETMETLTELGDELTLGDIDVYNVFLHPKSHCSLAGSYGGYILILQMKKQVEDSLLEEEISVRTAV